MLAIHNLRPRNTLIGLAVAAALATVPGCGGTSDGSGGGSSPGSGGSAAAPDTSSLTDATLRSGLVKGMTQGVTANTTAFSSVIQNAPAMKEITGKLGGGAPTGQGKSLQVTKASSGAGAVGAALGNFDMGNSLDTFDAMITKGSYTRNGNVYTFDPDENAVCTDPENTAQEVANCKAVLSHIKFVVTVNSVSGDQVTAATTRFNYDSSTFAVTDFTANTGYYEIEFPGTKALLNGFNEVAAPADKIMVPTTMEGSLRVGFKAINDNSGSVTVSIPQAIALTDNTPGEEVQLTLGQTSKLISMSADATNETMDLEVGFGALDLLTTDKDSSGNSLPVRLTLNALTGKMSVDANGTELKLTGLSANSVHFKVNGQDAVTLGLDSLDAILDASTNNAIVRLQKALNFNLTAVNVSNYLSDYIDSTNPAYRISAQVTAPANTVLTEVTNDKLKVTGGPLGINITETGKPGIAVSVPTGTCLDTSGDTPAAAVCPAGS